MVNSLYCSQHWQRNHPFESLFFKEEEEHNHSFIHGFSFRTVYRTLCVQPPFVLSFKLFLYFIIYIFFPTYLLKLYRSETSLCPLATLSKLTSRSLNQLILFRYFDTQEDVKMACPVCRGTCTCKDCSANQSKDRESKV